MLLEDHTFCLILICEMSSKRDNRFKFGGTRRNFERRRLTMFARKKAPDVQTSLQKFSDLSRDPSSRAKNFRLALDTLCVQEKRQLVDDYSFETFHLVDALLLQAEFSVEGNNVADAELALWALEQILCLAPELIGKGMLSDYHIPNQSYYFRMAEKCY